MSSTKTTGVVAIRREVVDCYPNLGRAVGHRVPCTIETFDCGNKLFKVDYKEFKKLGCDVGTCKQHYPLYGTEIEEIA